MLTNGIPKTAMTQKQPIFSLAKLGFEQPFPKASLLFSTWWTNFLNIISFVFYRERHRNKGARIFTLSLIMKLSLSWESPKLRVITQNNETLWKGVKHCVIPIYLGWLSTFLFDLSDSNSTQDQEHSMNMKSSQLVWDFACQRFPLSFNPNSWVKDMISHT